MKLRKLSIRENTKLIEDYIDGESKENLAKKYNIPESSVDRHIQSLPNEVARVTLNNDIVIARENSKIQSIKDQILDLVRLTVSEANNTENKLQYIDKIAALLEKMDKIFRLNIGEPTEHKKETEVKIDVAEIIKQAKTPEDRLKILQGQFYDK